MGRTTDGWPHDDELERLLAEALHAGAGCITDHLAGRGMSGEWSPARRVARNRRRRGWWVATAVVAVVGAATATVLLIGRGGGSSRSATGRAASSSLTSTGGSPVTSAGAGSSTPASPKDTARARPVALSTRSVHVTALESDGATYGVGLPVVLYFSPVPRSVTAFERATTVTVNGRPAGGAWYWVPPTADQQRHHEAEAHYRAPTFWPAHSHIHVTIPIGGVSAGPGLVYSDRLTSLDYRIGAAHVSYVDPADGLRMRVTSDGRTVNRLAVSLGASVTPTYDGTKIVMQKGETVPGTGRLRPDGTVLMSGPGYTDHPVAWSVRMTRSGEYVHAAPWNHAIGQRSTSNGCTNLSPADAKWFYDFSRLGDVVRYQRTGGGPMPAWDAVDDWNVPWPQWRSGGAARPGLGR